MRSVLTMAKVQIFPIFLLSQMLLFPVSGRRSDFCADKSMSFYADPEDCTSFYKCFLRNAFHFNCPIGLFYNEKFTVCDWPRNVACGQRSIPTPEPSTVSSDPGAVSTTQSFTTTTSLLQNISDSSANPNATQTPYPLSESLCQSKANGLYADSEDCNGYYQCHNGFSYYFRCQEDLVFNPDRQYCDWTWNVNCSVPTGNPVQNLDSEGNNQTGIDGKTATIYNYQPEECGYVVCYIPNWAIYRRGANARFGPGNVNPWLCTHVIYAFATLLGNRLVASETADEPNGNDIGNFARATNLKAQNPKLKVLLAVGGWNMASSLFSSMTASKSNREEFINTTIEFLRQRNFDGLSLDWVSSGWESPDLYKELYATLCEELRSAFDNEMTGDKRLILTGSVSGVKNIIDTNYDILKLASALDIINVMSYDLHGTWDGKTGHGSPLKAGSCEGNETAHLNVEWVANYWVSLGVPKNKLAIGVALYARTFTLSSVSNIEVGAPIAGPGSPGRHTAERGYLSYYEVCTKIDNTTKHFIESQRVPYLVSRNQWVGYEDPASLREKVQFIRKSGFLGIVAWDLSFDDFSGKYCGRGAFPLMNAILSQCVSPNVSSSVTFASP